MQKLLVTTLIICLQSCYAAKDICPDIVTKTDWGGRKALQVEYVISPVEYVIFHHTVTPGCRNLAECSDIFKSIQNFNMEQLEFDDIGYNFMIGGDGKVYEGTGWRKIGAHTKGYNSRSIGLGFAGNFSDKLPTEAQLDVAKKFIECAVKIGELKKNYKLIGGRQVSATQSPGLTFYKEIQKWNNFFPNP